MNYHFLYGPTQICCWQMKKDWWDAALAVLETEGSDAWAVMIKGA